MKLARWMEPRLYRLLRIPPEPDLLATDDQGYMLTRHDPDELRRWHLNLPWYGIVANRAMLTLHRAGHRDWGWRQRFTHHLGRPINRRRANRELAKARTLVYTSHYTHDPDSEMEVEGYFELPHGLVVWLTIRSACSFQVQAIFAWAHGDVYKPPVESWEEVVVVHTPTVEPGQVEEVLRRWYKERFAWTWGHWSDGGRLLPAFDIRLEWAKMADQSEGGYSPRGFGG